MPLQFRQACQESVANKCVAFMKQHGAALLGELLRSLLAPAPADLRRLMKDGLAPGVGAAAELKPATAWAYADLAALMQATVTAMQGPVSALLGEHGGVALWAGPAESPQPGCLLRGAGRSREAWDLQAAMSAWPWGESRRCNAYKSIRSRQGSRLWLFKAVFVHLAGNIFRWRPLRVHCPLPDRAPPPHPPLVASSADQPCFQALQSGLCVLIGAVLPLDPASEAEAMEGSAEVSQRAILQFVAHVRVHWGGQAGARQWSVLGVVAFAGRSPASNIPLREGCAPGLPASAHHHVPPPPRLLVPSLQRASSILAQLSDMQAAAEARQARTEASLASMQAAAEANQARLMSKMAEDKAELVGLITSLTQGVQALVAERDARAAEAVLAKAREAPAVAARMSSPAPRQGWGGGEWGEDGERMWRTAAPAGGGRRLAVDTSRAHIKQF